jgi:flagellar assembly factor FliW
VLQELSVETKFGKYLADGGAVVTVADGLPGFERCRQFVVVSGPTLQPFNCLQGMDDARPSFLTLDPRSVVDGYVTDLQAADRERLDAREDDALLWLALARLDGDRVLVNLRAPVVINARRMVGLQLIAADSPYSTEHVLPLD